MANPDVSSTRLYLGNLPRDVTKEDIQEHFKAQGAGNITEIKLMSGFGFIEYDDAMDARDIVPTYRAQLLPLPAPVRNSADSKTDGTDLKGNRLTVQFARGPRPRDEFPREQRPGPRPRRTAYKMQLTGLPEGTSWQDLKDFARQSGLDVVYSEVSRERDGRGFVEYESSADLRVAVEKLDNQEFKGANVHCISDEQAEAPQPTYPPDYRRRSRSPRRGGYGPPQDDYYARRGPPRGYSPRRDDYRRRTPPPREDYYARERYRSPPPRGVRPPPPEDPYGPPRGYRDDPYGPPPPRRYEDPYANGYERPPPRRSPPPPRSGGYAYDERAPRYW